MLQQSSVSYDLIYRSLHSNRNGNFELANRCVNERDQMHGEAEAALKEKP